MMRTNQVIQLLYLASQCGSESSLVVAQFIETMEVPFVRELKNKYQSGG
jgi:hypothetical protein